MNPSRADTRAVYDEIAAHFDGTRHHPWPEVREFVEAVSAGGVGLDVGCGNGRHLELLVDCVDRAVGVDLSTELLGIARERLAGTDGSTGADATAASVDRAVASSGLARATLVAGDAATLPIADDCVDVAVYVATLHHLPTADLRRQSLDELARVLAPDGVGLVSAWSTEHDRFDRAESFDATLDWELPSGETRERYYRVYAPADFEAALAASDLTIRDWEVSSGNCYARVEASG